MTLCITSKIVPRIISKRRDATNPARGNRVRAMMKIELEQARPHDVGNCGCENCWRLAQWCGVVTITAYRAACPPRTFTYDLPPLCNEHANAAIYGQRLPADLLIRMRQELSREGYGPAQTSTSIDLQTLRAA